MTANYRPLVWMGSRWGATEHSQGGHPSASVSDGTFRAGSLGPWNGPGQNHQKTAGLVFVAPASGVYRVTGVARSKPWTGSARVFRLGVLKKDTQRAALITTIELPGDATPVPLEVTVELTAGHELVFVPLMPDWHNATATTLEDLTISLRE